MFELETARQRLHQCIQRAGALLRFREYCQQSVVTGSDYLHNIISMSVTTEPLASSRLPRVLRGWCPHVWNRLHMSRRLRKRALFERRPGRRNTAPHMIRKLQSMV